MWAFFWAFLSLSLTRQTEVGGTSDLLPETRMFIICWFYWLTGLIKYLRGLASLSLLLSFFFFIIFLKNI